MAQSIGWCSWLCPGLQALCSYQWPQKGPEDSQRSSQQPAVAAHSCEFHSRPTSLWGMQNCGNGGPVCQDSSVFHFRVLPVALFTAWVFRPYFPMPWPPVLYHYQAEEPVHRFWRRSWASSEANWTLLFIPSPTPCTGRQRQSDPEAKISRITESSSMLLPPADTAEKGSALLSAWQKLFVHSEPWHWKQAGCGEVWEGLPCVLSPWGNWNRAWA